MTARYHTTAEPSRNFSFGEITPILGTYAPLRAAARIDIPDDKYPASHFSRSNWSGWKLMVS
jgi:hypothetical protein